MEIKEIILQYDLKLNNLLSIRCGYYASHMLKQILRAGHNNIPGGKSTRSYYPEFSNTLSTDEGIQEKQF